MLVDARIKPILPELLSMEEPTFKLNSFAEAAHRLRITVATITASNQKIELTHFNAINKGKKNNRIRGVGERR